MHGVAHAAAVSENDYFVAPLEGIRQQVRNIGYRQQVFFLLQEVLQGACCGEQFFSDDIFHIA
jgi:hypothetical protein